MLSVVGICRTGSAEGAGISGSVIRAATGGSGVAAGGVSTRATGGASSTLPNLWLYMPQTSFVTNLPMGRH